MEDTTPKNAAVENENLIAALSYFIFFLPLIAAKESKFAMYHANQAFNLFILWVVLTVANVVPILGQLVWFVGSILSIVLLVMGLINAFNGKEQPLPVIGKYKLVNFK